MCHDRVNHKYTECVGDKIHQIDNLEVALYLIPVGISGAPLSEIIPEFNIEITGRIKYFIVENIRSARRFIRRCCPETDISTLTFYELNRHTDLKEVAGFLEPLRKGEPMGVMSDAGCPAIADPGALVVSIARREGFKVHPLVGPSSILLALMASGFNGQGFAFRGYLPTIEEERRKVIRQLEAESTKGNMTQIFIETPYRNDKLLRSLLEALSSSTRLCVACDLTDMSNEEIVTFPVSEWRRILATKSDIYVFDKRPAIFLFYAAMEESVQQRKNSDRKKFRNQFQKI